MRLNWASMTGRFKSTGVGPVGQRLAGCTEHRQEGRKDRAEAESVSRGAVGEQAEEEAFNAKLRYLSLIR